MVPMMRMSAALRVMSAFSGRDGHLSRPAFKSSESYGITCRLDLFRLKTFPNLDATAAPRVGLGIRSSPPGRSTRTFVRIPYSGSANQGRSPRWSPALQAAYQYLARPGIPSQGGSGARRTLDIPANSGPPRDRPSIPSGDTPVWVTSTVTARQARKRTFSWPSGTLPGRIAPKVRIWQNNSVNKSTRRNSWSVRVVLPVPAILP